MRAAAFACVRACFAHIHTNDFVKERIAHEVAQEPLTSTLVDPRCEPASHGGGREQTKQASEPSKWLPRRYRPKTKHGQVKTDVERANAKRPQTQNRSRSQVIHSFVAHVVRQPANQPLRGHHNTPRASAPSARHSTTYAHTRARVGTHTHSHAHTHTRARAHAHTHTHALRRNTHEHACRST